MQCNSICIIDKQASITGKNEKERIQNDELH